MSWSVTAHAVMPAYLRPCGARLAALWAPDRGRVRSATAHRTPGGPGQPPGSAIGGRRVRAAVPSTAHRCTGGLAHTSSRERNRRSADQRAQGLARSLAIGSNNPGRDVLCILTSLPR